MSTINPTDPSSNVFNPFVDPNALTPDALLTYCQTQLGSYDSTIKGYLDEQKLNLLRKKVLSDVENAMKKVSGMDDAATQNYINAFKNGIASLPPGDPVAKQMQAQLDEIMSHRDGNGAISFTDEAWKAETRDIHSILDDVNGNAEINMIQLQSVMSQRQTAVQLTTSMLAKLDDSTKAILTNIGR